jgi:prepilin-type N-terminal cleavage/methylation domain-containing protein
MTTQRAMGRSSRAGFTLVELLIVTLVIAILATIVIGAYTNSLELGKQARTRAQIAKINSLIGAEWEKYRTLRVKLNTVSNDVKTNAKNRLTALRKLMRYEFPDRVSDVTGSDVTSDNDRPERSKQYKLMADQAQTKSGTAWTTTYQQAECLYLIVATSQDRNTSGLEFFRATEIGDRDGDGMMELLDGWGNPIRFLRWAPGFISDKQQAYRELSETKSGNQVVVNVTLDAGENSWVAKNPDPFDPLRVDENPVTFYLYPLVISAGGDGIFDIRFSVESGGDYTNPFYGVQSGASSSASDSPLGKYQDQGEELGANAQPNGKRNDLDNVHSHYVSVRIR